MTATGWGVQNEDSDTAATNLREVCILIKIHLTIVSLHNKVTVCYVQRSPLLCAPGLVKFVPPVPRLFCLALPGSFSTMFAQNKGDLCIVTTDSAATDFAKELQKEAIWRGGNAEHDVCNRGQCRDMLRKRSVDILWSLGKW